MGGRGKPGARCRSPLPGPACTPRLMRVEKCRSSRELLSPHPLARGEGDQRAASMRRVLTKVLALGSEPGGLPASGAIKFCSPLWPHGKPTQLCMSRTRKHHNKRTHQPPCSPPAVRAPLGRGLRSCGWRGPVLGRVGMRGGGDPGRDAGRSPSLLQSSNRSPLPPPCGAVAGGSTGGGGAARERGYGPTVLCPWAG
jgi:hypothetical protein